PQVRDRVRPAVLDDVDLHARIGESPPEERAPRPGGARDGVIHPEGGDQAKRSVWPMPRDFALASSAWPRAMSVMDRPRCQKRIVSRSCTRPGLTPATIWPSSACRLFSFSRSLST